MKRSRSESPVVRALCGVIFLAVIVAGCAEPKATVGTSGSVSSPLSPGIGEVEADRLRREAESRIEATEQIVRRIDEKKLAMDQQATLLTIQNFLVKAREALVAKDFIRASNLSDKAKVLAEGLPKT